MKNWFSQLTAQMTEQGRNTFRAALTFMAAGIVSLPLYIYIAFQSGAWQIYALMGSVAVFTGVCLWSALSVRRGNDLLGAVLVVGDLLIIIPLISGLISGLGVMLAAVGILLTLIIAAQTLPSQYIRWVIGLSITSGLLSVMLDLFNLTPSLVVPVINIYIPFIAGVLFLSYVIYVFRQFREFSLRAKLTIAFLGVAIISVVVVGSLTSWVVRAELSRQVGNNLDSLATTLGREVEGNLRSQLEILQVVATRFDRIAESASIQRSGTPEEIQEELLEIDSQWQAATGTDQVILDVVNNNPSGLLRDIKRTLPSHVEIFLTDQYGAMIAATGRTSDFYQGDENWWQTAYANGEGDFYIGQPSYDASAELLAIEFAVPVFANGRVVGILRSTYDASEFSKILESTGINEGSGLDVDIRLTDELGIEPETNELVPYDLETQAEFDRLAEGFDEIVFEGAAVLASLAPLSSATSDDPYNQAILNLGWEVIVHQEVIVAYAPVETTIRTITIVSIAILLLTGLVAYYISFNLSNPIVKLTSVAEEVAAGNLAVQAEVTTQDEIGTLATTFNSMTQQVRTLVGTLEQRVADRTRALTTSTEVSRRLSTILDQNELVREVVNQIQKAFDYYHVHIYLWDEKRENLIMAGGTGEAGRVMLASGHSIPAERGLVGRSAETGTIVLVSDVSQTIGWLPNPLLPDTKAEVAVPIISGDTVVGVLDVQHNIVGGLDQNDADLLQSIANQVAIALQNAGAYAAAQGNVERETRRNEIVQKIQSTTSIDEALRLVVREAGRLLGAEASIHLLGNSNSLMDVTEKN